MQNILHDCITKFFFQNSNLDWEIFYVVPCIVTKDSRLWVFQYKLLNKMGQNGAGHSDSRISNQIYL